MLKKGCNYTILLYAIGLLLVACTAHQSEDRLFTPTGSFSIGVSARQWIDESRNEVLTEVPEDKRKVTVWIWYPANADGGADPRNYLPDEHVDQTIKDSVTWFSGDAIATVEELSKIHLNAIQDAALSDAQETFPVVVFSNGLAPLPSTYSFQVEELASHGYVVVAVPHFFGYEIKSPARIGDASFTILSLTELLGEDLFFVLDQLEAINETNSGDIFAGRLDTDHIGIAGQSLGADVALWSTRRDQRLTAALIEDGYPEEPASEYVEVTQPVLFMQAERPLIQNYYRRVDGPAYVMQMEGIRHSTFLDQVLWSKQNDLPSVFGTIEPSRAVQIINTYALAFFNQYLKDVEQPLLREPSPDYPEVTLESRNTS